MSAGKKTLMSRILKYFPPDLIIELEKISKSHDIDNNAKGKEINALLTQYNVPYSVLGSGTNRYGVLIDGYAVKIALDSAGIIDNQREFKYTHILQPVVVKVYEISNRDWLIIVTEYISIFSLEDFYDHQSEMRDILSEVTQRYLVGDVGVSTNNYINWGIRMDGSICMLDFAYIYNLSYKSFVCSCEDEGVLQYDNDYNYLICPYCRRKYSFADIRKTITKEDELAEIGNVLDMGYVINNSEEVVDIDERFTILEDGKPKKKKKHEEVHEELEPQDWDLDGPDQEYILNAVNETVEKYKNIN